MKMNCSKWKTKVFSQKAKIALLSVFFFLGVFIFTGNVSAQTSNIASPQSLPLNTNPNVPQNINTYTQTTFINILATASCFLTGYDPLSTNGKCLGIDPTTRKVGYVENGTGGLLTLSGNLIGSTYNIPVSSVEYGKYVASNFGITRNSYAATPTEQCLGTPPESMGACLDAAKASQTGFGQGIGFKGLTPVLKIWETFRNLVYLLFVLVFILLGLGIMFRINIDARTVMSIQNQIPKIVIALILITFSYAIVGFLIDMMYVSIYLVIQLFHSQGLTTITNIDTNPVNAVGGLGGINNIATPAAKGIANVLGSLFEGGIGEQLARIVTGIIAGMTAANMAPEIAGFSTNWILGPIMGAAGYAFGTKVFGLIALIIAYLIIAIAILSALLRVWFMLIKAYVFIILDVIFAPFWILKGVIPGAGGGVGPWLRSVTANLAAFPVVIVLFLIGKAVQDNVVPGQATFIPPLVGDPGDNGVGAIASILGLGMILIMPEAVNITKQALKAPDLKIAGAAGRALGSGQKLITSPIKGGWNKVWGEDAMGNPKLLTRIAEERGGRLTAAVFGGSFKSKRWDPEKNDGKGGYEHIPWIKNPLRRNKGKDSGNNPAGAAPAGREPAPSGGGATGSEVATGPSDDADNANPEAGRAAQRTEVAANEARDAALGAQDAVEDLRDGNNSS